MLRSRVKVFVRAPLCSFYPRHFRNRAKCFNEAHLLDKLYDSPDNSILYRVKASDNPNVWFSLDLETRKAGVFPTLRFDEIMHQICEGVVTPDTDVFLDGEGNDDEEADDPWEI